MKKPTKTSEPAATSKSSGLDAKGHKQLFASAMKLFTSGDFKKAKSAFEEASAGPLISVNESAAMYIRMCQQRLAQDDGPAPRTAEELYHYAVSLINVGDFAKAETHLSKALASGETPHVLYALALSQGRNGKIEEAAATFRRACQMDPSNRALARSDSDFLPLLQHEALREIVTGERPATA